MKPSVVIIGAGEFGASAGVELLESGNYSQVTILDKADVLPAVDAASTDINKVVRWDYPDPIYTKLGREAVKRWNKDGFKGIYHETGVVIRGVNSDQVRKSYANSKSMEPAVRHLSTRKDLESVLAPDGGVEVADAGEDHFVYLNPYGGWANAAEAVKKLYRDFNRLGGKLVPSAELADFIYTKDGKDVRGVRTVDGRQFLGDKVILALGSWTGGHPAISKLLPQGLLVPTGQTIVAVQLNKEEMKRYSRIPTTLGMNGTGFYSFPPNETGLLKFALHSNGYTVPTNTPRTAGVPEAVKYTEDNKLSWVPRDSLDILREQMGKMYPEIAAKDVAFTRMCWYSDTVDSHWVIDYTKYPSLMVASGGAGHAFKFLPVMGELIRSRLENTLAPELKEIWSINRTTATVAEERAGKPRRPLVLSQLATQQELRGVKAKL